MLRPWPISLKISQDKRKPLYIRIADSIIEAIKSGSLKSGEALPGSRQMAEMLKVNRNTIIKVYDLLIVEGWLISESKRGTFVSDHLLLISSPSPKTLLDNNINKNITQAGNILFDSGLPDPAIIPIDEIAKAYRRIFSQRVKRNIFEFGDEQGSFKFRNAVSQMLNFNKGMSTSPDEICITRGSQMAFFLTAHCHIKPKDVVLVENPGYRPAWEAFKHAGAELIPINIDREGIDVTAIKSILKKTQVKAIYLTPHHQYPTTVTLALSRRLELIELSNLYGFTIIEDDYDSDFYFGKRPIPPICSHKELNSFVYVSTLSKLISPSVRIGYLYSNINIIKKVAELRKIVDMQSDTIMEQSILELINSGDVRRHRKRASNYYQNKRDVFEKLLDKYLKGKATYNMPEGGLAVWLSFPSNVDLFKLHKVTAKKGLNFYTPERFSFDEPINGIRIGYASLSESDMERGLLILSKYV
ncbi:PLP-dependent aminotransferase family protein [Dysgonomonas sp. Marseille-P4677]|uniref:MocR-like pyridoxine biosynthesis transcription factor PdxR n=1 Tax=Dysgonomonas sp. Marseille-P4677 TaxID=2364790 RepID=UPI001912B467|nr:PLP-dependent aminotransferase family protein [Dysgonomonas sp. Marseille-P4677]MBK5721807.1 PLP-dependent aminotransferase family protein [Dysgonomonas sp. Marseille-P4677]